MWWLRNVKEKIKTGKILDVKIKAERGSIL